MKRICVPLCSLLLILVGITGCTSVYTGAPLNLKISSDSTFKTRTELIENVGIPSNVRKQGGNTYYTYVFREGYGGGIGLGTFLIGFLVGHTKVESDTYVVTLDSQDQVENVYALARSDDIPYRLWPFGD